MSHESQNTSLGNKSVYIERAMGNVQIFQYDSDEIVEEIEDAINGNAQKELFIIVLCEDKSTINSIQKLSSIRAYYSNNYLEWRPFKGKTIGELLCDYEEESGYKVRFLNYNYTDEIEISKIVEFEDVYLSKIVVITDGLALSDEKKRFIQSIDHKMHIGGFLLPLDENIDSETKKDYKKYCASFFPRMLARYNTYSRSYSNILIEAKDSAQLYRCLTSFAQRLKIKSSKSKPVFAKFESEGLKSLRADGR